METLSESRCHGGRQIVCRHSSDACKGDMTFGLFLPPAAEAGPVPLLWYLSGLTCTHENAMTKAAMQGAAAASGLAICFPDTSPRGEGVADDEAYDLGQGAGFYVNAAEAPWAPHFSMYDYIVKELPAAVQRHFPVAPRYGITGHSMGGHGALVLAMRNPDIYRSLSAFAPIANPVASEWGRKQFAAYLGPDESLWAEHDASLLMAERGWKGDILIDQGLADPFLEQLRPEALAMAAAARRQAITLRMQAGYDHSYFFVASFAAEHVAWHAARLAA